MQFSWFEAVSDCYVPVCHVSDQHVVNCHTLKCHGLKWQCCECLSYNAFWVPCTAGVSLPVVDEEDMEALAADQLYSSADCAQLLLQTTVVENVTRPASR